MAEVKRVLRPSGSVFVNLGDKYAGNETGGLAYSGGGSEIVRRKLGNQQERRSRHQTGLREKSLLGLPWAFALGCTGMLAALGGPDPGLDLILRAGIVWEKVNGLPESVRDRVRMSHEMVFHFTKEPRYYSAVDEVREPQATIGERHGIKGGGRYNEVVNRWSSPTRQLDPLGKLPGSVWAIPSEPLDLPGYFILSDGRLVDFLAPQRGGARPKPNGHHPGLFDLDTYREVVASGDGPAWRWSRATGVTSSPWPQQDGGLQLRVAASHYAAFPSRLPELIVRGWSPPGVCCACGEGRWPVVDRPPTGGFVPDPSDKTAGASANGSERNRRYRERLASGEQATILGYACKCCPFTDHPGTGEPSGPDGRYGDHLAEGGGYANVGAGFGGKGGLGDRPRVGPWREYHLTGWQAPPTRPAVVLDCFGGVGTSAMVARALGRVGLSFDLSFPYSRAARWRVTSDHAAKAISRTNRERQQELAL